MNRQNGILLTYRVAEDLGRAIICGEYSAERPLPGEADLARVLGVSRTLVREAIKMITPKGLVVARPKVGLLVQPAREWNFLDPDILRWISESAVSTEVLLELAQLMGTVEGTGAYLAAQHATEKQKDDLRTIMNRLIRADAGDGNELMTRIEFHSSVLSASGNRFFASLTPVSEALLRLRQRMRKGPAFPSVAAYQKVYSAIMDTNSSAANRSAFDLVQELIKGIPKGHRSAMYRCPICETSNAHLPTVQ